MSAPLEGTMESTHELRYLCLLAAASGLAYNRIDRVSSPRRMQASLRCVLYMVVAISMRRRNVGRRNLRTAPDNPNTPNSSRLRFVSYSASAFRCRMRIAFTRAIFPSLDKRGAPSITYM